MTTLYVRDDTGVREATTEEILTHPAATPQTSHVRHLLVGTHGDLRIQGRWFESAGFAIGAQVRLRVFRKRLVIDIAKEPTEKRPPSYRRYAQSGLLT